MSFIPYVITQGRIFRDAESWISKKCWKLLKNCQKCRKNGGKMAIWLGIIVFITYFNTYGTDTNTCGKKFEDTERSFWKKNDKKWEKCQKIVKNVEKMAKNGNIMGYNRVYYIF